MVEKFKVEEMKIRPATKEDMASVAEMVKELVDFHNMSDGPKKTVKDLQHDGFERQPPSFRIVVAEMRGGGEVAVGSAVVGYALFYPTYSSKMGRTMMLQDLYVRANQRQRGVGGMLFDAVAKEASLSGCSCLDLHVMEWNPACSFYEAMGAVNLTKKEQWSYYRLSGDAFHKLA